MKIFISSKNPIITYNTAGTYQVVLTVANSKGNDSETKNGYITVNSLGGITYPVISQSEWTLKSVDSEEITGENGAAINAFDGDVNTIWHTLWTVSSPYPHEIQINLGTLYSINELRYLPRQNAENTRIANYEIYVSKDGSTWGTVVATGTWPNTATEQKVRFSAVIGQYVRLVGLSAANGTPFAGAAEINICGTTDLSLGFSAVDETEKGLSVNCYPNPTIGVVEISLKGKTIGAISIRVISLSGQILYQKEEYKNSDEFNIAVNLDDLPRQMYILQVISKTGRSQTKVLLINKPKRAEEQRE